MHPPSADAESRRAWLALKGRLLYGKYCGTQGEGICAENFALYHLRKGECESVRDFLTFLDEQIATQTQHDPDNRLAMTQRLAERIRRHLAGAEEVSPPLSQTIRPG
jgi:hypothetical protein